MPGESSALELSHRRVRFRFDPSLVEASVLLAVDAVPQEERREFRQDRDPLYELAAGERREDRFRALHAHWFVRLGIPSPLFRLLAEAPAPVGSIEDCLVVPVVRAKEEYADLHDRRDAGAPPPAGGPLLLLRLRAKTLVDPLSLGGLLRHELLHVADILDPAFGFARDPALPPEAGAGTGTVMERYRVLWDVTIDGRLAARRQLPAAGRERRRREFAAAFAVLGDGWEESFERFFGGPRPTHRELLAFATQPGQGPRSTARDTGRCPLCRMPTGAFHPAPQSLGERALAAIRRDFPEWRAGDGLCRQCADLYDLRSRAGA